LITWESSREDYVRDLLWPRVVAILKPQLSSRRIKQFLALLYTSERQLTFSEKIGGSLCKPNPGFLRTDQDGRIYCGGNPWLCARVVSELFVDVDEEDDHHETLHWIEPAAYESDPATNQLFETHAAKPRSEEVHFDRLWQGIDPSNISGEEFAGLHRRLTEAGYLRSGFVGEDADWELDFSHGKEITLLGMKKFFQDVGHDLTPTEWMLLHFMLQHTNKDGKAAGADEGNNP